MATGTTVLESAMQDIGVLATGASASTSEKAYGLTKINNILGSWSYEQLLIPYRVKESLSVANAITSRTIGSGADWNTVRPTKILSLWWKPATNTSEPIKLISAEEFGALEAKDVSTGRPDRMYYEPVDSSNITRGVLYFDKTTAATETLFMISEKELSELSAITDTISLPTPWIDALTKTLAIDIAGKFGVNLKDSHAVTAKLSLDKIAGLRSRYIETKQSMAEKAVAEVMS